jgi:hypothetical protein
LNAPAKDGKTVNKIISKQLARFAATECDIISGTGDGGGENEGKHGIHAHYEAESGLYVRRRGLEHIAWTVCKSGLEEAGALTQDLCIVAAYLHEGITWRRLQSIATSTAGQGGLGLMIVNSDRFVEVFNKSPPSLIDGRPETTLEFIRWLQPRQVVRAALKADAATADSLLGECLNDCDKKTIHMFRCYVERDILLRIVSLV